METKERKLHWITLCASEDVNHENYSHMLLMRSSKLKQSHQLRNHIWLEAARRRSKAPNQFHVYMILKWIFVFVNCFYFDIYILLCRFFIWSNWSCLSSYFYWLNKIHGKEVWGLVYFLLFEKNLQKQNNINFVLIAKKLLSFCLHFSQSFSIGLWILQI